MSEVRHTPGPWSNAPEIDGWSVDSDNHSGLSWHGIGIANREPIAFAVWIGHYRDPEYNANVRLIAAAPELIGQLEAAQTDLDLLRRAIELDDPKAELLIRVTDLWKRNAAAIARAKGDRG